jgi:hypothetical protein
MTSGVFFSKSRATAVPRQIQVQRHLDRRESPVAANKIHARDRMTQHTGTAVFKGRANVELVQSSALDPFRVSGRPAIGGGDP